MSGSGSPSSGRSRSRSYSPSRPARDEESNEEDKTRHFGDREDPQTSNVLAIFNLNLKTNEEDIRREFGGYGAIVKCRIVMDQKRNKSRGFCFITFGEEKDAIAAKTKAHGSTIHDKEIRVDYSITRRAHSPTPGVYMGHKGKEKIEKDVKVGVGCPVVVTPPVLVDPPRKKVTKRELSISPDRPRHRGYKSRSRSRSPHSNSSVKLKATPKSSFSSPSAPSTTVSASMSHRSRRNERSRSKSRERERNNRKRTENRSEHRSNGSRHDRPRDRNGDRYDRHRSRE